MKIQPFLFDRTHFQLKVLDQTQLPVALTHVDVKNVQDGFRVIKDMLVRGAPCIAAVACLSIIAEANNELDPSTVQSVGDLNRWLSDRASHLAASRPTAVNLKQALAKLVEFAGARKEDTVAAVVHSLSQYCIRAIDLGLAANRQLSEFGAGRLLSAGKARKLTLVTHCNTGALATVGHGTALGVVKTLHELNQLERVYCTETRPYNQGSRLTAWELLQEDIPATLIADSMVAHLMQTREVDAVVVGADRIAANGDTANKIGTLQVAVVARNFAVPFYVAGPTQTIDMATRSGADIVIEQRPAREMRTINGQQVAPEAVEVWNPCFDVTPAALIDGIITERGICEPSQLEDFLRRVGPPDGDDALF